MSGVTIAAAALFCLVTAGVLAVGVIGFGTGRASGSTSNRIMRLRILCQFAAICCILAAIGFA